WDVAQRQVVAGFDVGVWAGLNYVALLQTSRSQDVALGAIDIVQQCDVGRTVWVVLDVCDFCRYAVLVATTEVDQAVLALVATTAVAGCDATKVVAATGFCQWTQQ